MARAAPPFWWQPTGWRAVALLPAAAVYGAVARRRLVTALREPVDLPVLCVGNLTVGGSGKTPVAIALAEEAKRMGLRPGFLSRGHGARPVAPRLVESGDGDPAQVGDEPLLLARYAAVAVTPDRAAGARLLKEHGCDLVIMDDGFQSARLHMDQSLIVVDSTFGIGNGWVLPAGPLRAPVRDQLRFADAIVRMGDGAAGGRVVRMAARAGKPVYEAIAVPRHGERLRGRRFLAFAGIGHPEKFFATLSAAGSEVVAQRAFPDHHPFTEWEARDLMSTARTARLELATTAKDAVRFAAIGLPAGFREMLTVLEIDAVFDDPGAPQRILRATLAARAKRRLATAASARD